MWRIGFLVWISCLSTQICGQSSSPPQITGFLSHDLVKPDEVKFARRFDASQNWGFRLPCEASGAHSLQWRWQHNGTDIVYGAKYKLGDDGSLTGEYLVAENSGNYQCFVRDTVTAKEVFSRRLKVAVTHVGDFASKVNETLTIDLGQSLRVQCPQHAPNYGASYSWESKNGTPFKRDHHRVISPDGELFIMYVTQKDVDEIASLEGIGCTITGGDTIYRSGLLTLKKRALYDPGTLMSPSWRVLPSSETATQGKKQTLYCLAVGRPPPRITWKKHGQQITHGWNSFEIPDAFYGRLLNIISVRRDLHQDVYTCEAENSQNSGNPLVYTINLNVEVPPRWTGDTPPPTKKNIDIGGNARLLCNAVADPRPSYKWYKDGSRITSSSNNVKKVNDTLEFKTVRLQEDGVYQCVAENRVGMIVSYTWVHVRALPPTFVEFGPFYLYKDREARLKCQPDAAPRPTIWWYKGGSEITTGARYKVESDGTLVIDKVNKQDAGQYQCRAQNILDEASANASAYVLEVPYPPTNLQITDTCHNRTTTLSWVTRSSNDAPIKYFLVEQESNHESNVFRLIYNVTNPNATSIRLNLTGWATLRFRMMAITSLGSSRPSLPTEEGVCSTSLGAPDKFPGNLRGESKKSEELNITWTPLPKIDWNAPGLYYILQYRRVTDKPPVWEEENITDPTVGMFTVQEPGHCELWEFQICAANDKGLGPFSAIEQSIFGLHTPKGKPENVTVDKITIHSVNVSWAPVADSKEGGFDGYRIYYWRESRFVNGKRRRRDIPSYAYFTNVTGGKTHQTTVYGLKPDTNYKLVIKAFSCGGAEGPASDEVTFSTLRAVSTGRPSKTPTDSATLAGSAAPKGSAPRQCHAFFSRVIVFGLSFSNILYHF